MDLARNPIYTAKEALDVCPSRVRVSLFKGSSSQISIVRSPPVVTMSRQRIQTNEAHRRTSGDLIPIYLPITKRKSAILCSEEPRLRTRNIGSTYNLFICVFASRRWQRLFLYAQGTEV